MTDFSKILAQAKELEIKMKESQEKIKNITVDGTSGSNSVKVVLNGDGEIIKIDISPETLKEEKTIVEDLIMAAHNNAKLKLTIAKYYTPSGRCIQKLDYSQRDDFGDVDEVPDSLIHKFKKEERTQGPPSISSYVI